MGTLNKIIKAFSKLEQEFEREPTSEELADILHMTVSEVENSLKVSGRHISVDAPLTEGEDNSLLDVLRDDAAVRPDTSLIDESLSREVEYALLVLTTREADVLRYFFGLGGRPPQTLEEIGTNLGLELEMVGTKLPRLTGETAIDKLQELEGWLR